MGNKHRSRILALNLAKPTTVQHRSDYLNKKKGEKTGRKKCSPKDPQSETDERPDMK
jgi:hypothetical protein